MWSFILVIITYYLVHYYSFIICVPLWFVPVATNAALCATWMWGLGVITWCIHRFFNPCTIENHQWAGTSFMLLCVCISGEQLGEVFRSLCSLPSSVSNLSSLSPLHTLLSRDVHNKFFTESESSLKSLSGNVYKQWL